MKERPILMSGPMVRAILEGRKTQTRRVIKPQPIHIGWFEHQNGWCAKVREEGDGLCAAYDMVRCPYGAVGDLLWVRETFTAFNTNSKEEGAAYLAAAEKVKSVDDIMALSEMPMSGGGRKALYRADFGDWANDPDCDLGPWTPSIHMPRWASRLTLRITGVRVERVQEISDQDALAEGVQRFEYTSRRLSPCVPHGPDEGHEVEAVRYGTEMLSLACMAETPARGFRNLWQSINGGREGCSWQANPWVWAISFEVVKNA